MTETRTLPRTADEMRARAAAVETRTLTLDEIRATVDDGPVVVTGHAAVFDSPSVDMYGWYEIVKRGAFRKVLSTNPDVRLLVNHDGLPLARSTNGTLTLREDTKGLAFRAELPDTQLARDVAALLERGDLSQMSFAFRVDPDSVEWVEDADGRERREIGSFSALREVSLVTFPAYEATDAEVERQAPDDTTFRTDDDQEQPPDEGAGSEVDDSPDADDTHAGAPDGGAATQRWRARSRSLGLLLTIEPKDTTHA